jgi:hypothetical protein
MEANGGRRFLSTNLKNRGAEVVAIQDDPETIPAPEITEEEYKDMVNTYGLPSDKVQAKAKPANKNILSRRAWL